jgi:hypothetical protein
MLRRSFRARSVFAPMTMRSGRMKFSTAWPSRRNSGLEATSKETPRLACFFKIACTLSPVPTGTVLFCTTSRYPGIACATLFATSKTARRSAVPSRRGGVPTHVKMTSPQRVACSRDVLNRSLLSRMFRATRSFNPGS